MSERKKNVVVRSQTLADSKFSVYHEVNDVELDQLVPLPPEARF
jgi:hypothetical protein